MVTTAVAEPTAKHTTTLIGESAPSTSAGTKGMAVRIKSVAMDSCVAVAGIATKTGTSPAASPSDDLPLRALLPGVTRHLDCNMMISPLHSDLLLLPYS